MTSNRKAAASVGAPIAAATPETLENPGISILSQVPTRFMGAAEVAADCSVSLSKAYSIIKQLNKELAARGYLTIPGKVSRAYYEEKTYKGAAG